MLKYNKKLSVLLLVLSAAFLANAQNAGECIYGDCKKGFGKYRYPGGQIYIGEFKSSKPHGEGELTEIHVDTTQWFLNSKEQKQNTTTSIQKGIWKDGEINGQGYMLVKSKKFEEVKEMLPDSSNGKRYVWKSYSTETILEITGNFVNGILDGYAVTESYKTSQDNPNSKIGIKKYEGYFKNSEPNGRGKLYKWANGAYQLTNDGEFLNGKYIGLSK